MSKDKEPLKHVWVRCRECGGSPKKHEMVHQDEKDCGNEEEGHTHTEYSLLIRCGGCESVKLCQYTIDAEDYRYQSNPEPSDNALKIYPDDATTHNKRQETIAGLMGNSEELIPEDVHKMYVESIRAFEARVLTLASVGIRATIEAICKHLGMEKYKLDSKIKELVEKKLLAQPQADLLHEGQFLGNDAAHEMTTPESEEVEDGLQIIESMINLIYVVPEKAKRMKAKRLKRTAAKTPSTAVTKPKQK